jgi:hypothetical protein
MAGEGRAFIQSKFEEYDQIVKSASTAQEKRNYASQALEITGKVNSTQEDTDQLVMIVQRLT